MTTLAPPVLRLDRIHHQYGQRTTVDGLSLSLEAGAICCLLGPSGCGKTTVLRCVGGFERIDAGEIRIDGALVGSRQLHVPPEQRRIGMVFQDYALFPHLDVERNVGFGLRGGGGDAERVRQLLDTVGLASAARRYPHELSGGQQQRVALARALAPRPRQQQQPGSRGQRAGQRDPGCCCWTSRSPTSTWSCVSSWRRRCAPFSRRSARRRCSSRMTSTRPLPSPTRSR
jgi:ABC-type uncharacterized transport system YnjBCD ATPase subunit